MEKKFSKKRRSSAPRLKPVAKNCPFCRESLEPDYKDSVTLEKFITDRAKILGKARTGVCAKHQRRLSVSIKRARHLGILPFTPSV